MSSAGSSSVAAGIASASQSSSLCVANVIGSDARAIEAAIEVGRGPHRPESPEQAELRSPPSPAEAGAARSSPIAATSWRRPTPRPATQRSKERRHRRHVNRREPPPRTFEQRLDVLAVLRLRGVEDQRERAQIGVIVGAQPRDPVRQPAAHRRQDRRLDAGARASSERARGLA